MPGSAKQIIDAGLHSVRTRDEAIERLTWAEAVSVTFASVMASLLPVGLVILAVVLASNEKNTEALVATAGAFVTAAPKLIDAIKGNSSSGDE